MAAGATLYNIEIDLADADRRVYETLALHVAQHPSESEEFLVARVLAYALEFTDGIAFSSGGVSSPDEPPIAVRDLTGSIRVGAGDVRICAPPGLGLRIRADGTAEQLQVQGVRQTSSVWQNPGYVSATHRAELTVTAHFGVIEIDPIGGCS